MSAGFEFVVQNDHPTSSLHFYVDNNWTCLDVEFIEPAGFTDRTPFDIAAGGGYSFKLYRLDGHGCDGKQGTFTIVSQWRLANGSLLNLKKQSFQFSDQGQIDFLTEQEDNSGTAFSSRIDQLAVGTRAIWSLAPLMEPLTEPEPNQQQEIDMKK